MLKVVSIDDSSCNVINVSQVSGKAHEMTLPVSAARVTQWAKHGELVQRAFPELSKAQREFLMTGITQDEWNDIFQGED